MAEQLIKKNTEAIGARNLGMKLMNNSLIGNPQLNVLKAKTEFQTET
jgi:hypothetical protein